MSGEKKEESSVASPLSGFSTGQGESNSHGEGLKANGDKFESISNLIQENTEALKESAREIEKANNRFMFQSSTLTPSDEASLMNKVNHVVKYSGIKNRDTTRLVKLLRKEALNAQSQSKPPEDGERNKHRDFIRYVFDFEKGVCILCITSSSGHSFFHFLQRKRRPLQESYSFFFRRVVAVSKCGPRLQE